MMSDFIQNVPWFLPGVAIWTVFAIIVFKPLAGFLGTRRVIALLLTMSVGLILFATLTPVTPDLDAGIAPRGQCDLSRVTIASWSTLTTYRAPSLNIVLFVPLGFALGLLPRTSRNVAIVLGAFLLTVLVEATQSLVSELGRGCESADIVDNTMGLAIGLAAGLVVTVVAQRSRGPNA